MRVLIVDNGSKHIVALRRSFAGHEIVVARYRSRKINDVNADLIVMSGGHLPIVGGYWYYKRELDLIRTTQIPVIGICLGCELIARANKLPLYRLKRKVVGLQQILLFPSYLAAQETTATVYEAHRWIIKAPGDFHVLARSTRGIEIIKHPTKEIYGLQFHAEVARPLNDGAAILGKTVAQIVANKA